MNEVAGGFGIGGDKFTREEYARAGIEWEQNTLTQDKYTLKNGYKLNQDQAEYIAEFYHNMSNTDLNGKQLDEMMQGMINSLK